MNSAASVRRRQPLRLLMHLGDRLLPDFELIDTEGEQLGQPPPGPGVNGYDEAADVVSSVSKKPWRVAARVSPR